MPIFLAFNFTVVRGRFSAAEARTAEAPDNIRAFKRSSSSSVQTLYLTGLIALLSKKNNQCLASPFLTLFVRVHPLVRRDFAGSRKLDHSHWRRGSTFPTRPTLQPRFELPDRCIARPANSIQRQARSCLVAVALSLEPTQAAVEALSYRR